MAGARILAAMGFLVFAAGGSVAQDTVRPATPRTEPAIKALTSPSNPSSKANPNPANVNLGKEAKDKLKREQTAACKQKCADDFPVSSAKKAKPANSGSDPCAGKSKLTGAYQKCVSDNLNSPAAASSAIGGGLTNTINKPKYEACIKTCDRRQ